MHPITPTHCAASSHSAPPQHASHEARQAVGAPAGMVSDRAYLRMRDAFIRWHAFGCFGAAAEYQEARQAWELAVIEQGAI